MYSGFDVYGRPQYGFQAAKVSTPVSGTPTEKTNPAAGVVVVIKSLQ